MTRGVGIRAVNHPGVAHEGVNYVVDVASQHPPFETQPRCRNHSVLHPGGAMTTLQSSLSAATWQDMRRGVQPSTNHVDRPIGCHRRAHSGRSPTLTESLRISFDGDPRDQAFGRIGRNEPIRELSII